MILFFVTFGLSAVLLVISLSMKTVMLSLKVLVKGAEVAVKSASKFSRDVGLGDVTDSVGNAVQKTGAVAKKTVNTAKSAGKATVNTAKTAGKAVKTTGKVAYKAGKLSIKAIKLMIRAIQGLIHLIHTVVAALVSLGVVGIVILVVIILFVLGAVAAAVLFANNSFAGTGVVGGGGGTSGGYNPLPGPSGSVVTPGDTTALYNACKTMGEWYIANVPTYQGNANGGANGYVQWYDCNIMPFGTMKVGDECGRFAAAYASYVSGQAIVNEGSLKTIYNGSAAWTNAGWKYYTMDEIGGVAGLLPGDVMMCADKTDPCSRGGHAEVYLGTNQTFGWGQIQSKFPSNTSTLTDWTCPHGNIYVQAGAYGHRYGRIFRYAGGSTG